MKSDLDPALGRFTSLAEEDRDEFPSSRNTVRNLSGSISQIIPFADSDLETLYTCAKFLETMQPYRSDSTKRNLDGEVTLKLYECKKISDASTKFSSGETVQVRGSAAVGNGNSKEPEGDLSNLITILNERRGPEFTQTDELSYPRLSEETMADDGFQEATKANTNYTFRYVSVKAPEGLFIDRIEQKEELFTKYTNAPDFKRPVLEHRVQQVGKKIRSKTADSNTEE